MEGEQLTLKLGRLVHQLNFRALVASLRWNRFKLLPSLLALRFVARSFVFFPSWSEIMRQGRVSLCFRVEFASFQMLDHLFIQIHELMDLQIFEEGVDLALEFDFRVLILLALPCLLDLPELLSDHHFDLLLHLGLLLHDRVAGVHILAEDIGSGLLLPQWLSPSRRCLCLFPDLSSEHLEIN